MYAVSILLLGAAFVTSTGQPAADLVEDAALASFQFTPSTHAPSITFVENLGQWPVPEIFVARTPSMIVRAGTDKIALQVFEHHNDPTSGVLLELGFDSACENVHAEGLSPLAGLRHYFLGNDPALWRSNARSFGAVRLKGVWSETDVVLREGDQVKLVAVVSGGSSVGRGQNAVGRKQKAVGRNEMSQVWHERGH